MSVKKLSLKEKVNAIGILDVDLNLTIGALFMLTQGHVPYA